jgi:hypothetical protein
MINKLPKDNLYLSNSFNTTDSLYGKDKAKSGVSPEDLFENQITDTFRKVDKKITNNAIYDNPLELRKKIEGILRNEGADIPQTQEGNPIATRQYADNKGRITSMVLLYSPGLLGQSMLAQLHNTYKILFENMEPDTKFTIGCSYKDEIEDLVKLTKESGIKNPERIKFVEAKEICSIWARDMLVSTFDKNEPDKCNMLSTQHIHSTDGKAPAKISAAIKDPNLGVINQPCLVIDGGDTVSNSKESFIGYNSIYCTREELKLFADKHPDFKKWATDYYYNTLNKEVQKIDKPGDVNSEQSGSKIKKYPEKKFGAVSEDQMYEDLAIELFREYFDKPVTPMGKDDPSTPKEEGVASFHQDMCTTPVSDNTFFLGDPTLFKKILQEMTPQERQKAEEQFAKVNKANVTLDEFVKQSEDKNKSENFEAYAKTFKEKNYEIIRLPFYSSYSNLVPNFTYNNCLMEDFEKDGKHIKRVFLPIIGVDIFDNYATDAYKQQGFEVFPIPMAQISKEKGELRCITNWLGRSEKV